MKKSLFYFPLLVLLTLSCTKQNIEIIYSTEKLSWLVENKIQLDNSNVSPDLIIDRSQKLQPIEGFGACFNELGWDALNALSENDRQAIMSELFTPIAGANFTICRMPVGSNDFSLDWYSYNEVDGDFAMDNFSISNDLETLIPYITEAQKYNLSLKIWASPWNPQSWMKWNKHYVC